MRRWFVVAILLVVAFAMPGVAIANSSNDQAEHFSATLTGDEEVPPVVTSGSGQARFEVTEDETGIDFEVGVSGLVDITQAHIHLGKPGENGPIVAYLFGLVSEGVNVEGQLARGTITAGHLVGPLRGHPLSDLIDAIRSGNAYPNVHTKARPGGEIRGQITSDED